MTENKGAFGKREEDDYFFYDGVLAGLAHEDFREGHLQWIREHLNEVNDAAKRGVLAAKSVLDILNHYQRK